MGRKGPQTAEYRNREEESVPAGLCILYLEVKFILMLLRGLEKIVLLCSFSSSEID